MRPGYVPQVELLNEGLDEFKAMYDGFNAQRTMAYSIPDYVYPIGSNMEGLDIPKSLRINKKKPCRWQLARAINEALPADDYSRMRGNYDGVRKVMDRLKSLGNSIVPQVAYQIMKAIKEVD